MLEYLSDILSEPPESEKYKALKKELISVFADSDSEKLGKLYRKCRPNFSTSHKSNTFGIRIRTSIFRRYFDCLERWARAHDTFKNLIQKTWRAWESNQHIKRLIWKTGKDIFRTQTKCWRRSCFSKKVEAAELFKVGSDRGVTKIYREASLLRPFHPGYKWFFNKLSTCYFKLCYELIK